MFIELFSLIHLFYVNDDDFIDLIANAVDWTMPRFQIAISFYDSVFRLNFFVEILNSGLLTYLSFLFLAFFINFFSKFSFSDFKITLLLLHHFPFSIYFLNKWLDY